MGNLTLSRRRRPTVDFRAMVCSRAAAANGTVSGEIDSSAPFIYGLARTGRPFKRCRPPRRGDRAVVRFVSAVNAFVMRGAMSVFVDIRPETFNLDERLFEKAVTPRIKIVVPVYYAGFACAMDSILKNVDRQRLLVVEDAAQGVCAACRGRRLGTSSV